MGNERDKVGWQVRIPRAARHFHLLFLIPLVMAACGGGGDGSAFLSAGAEQRCNELGANCVCSEPFNTDTLAQSGSFWLNPADSATKECIHGSAAIEANPLSTVRAVNDPLMLNALPSGHSINFAVGGPDGQNVDAIFWIGHDQIGGQFIKRAAFRFYVYFSPNYQFKGEGGCQNSKFGGLPGGTVDVSFGQVHIYGFGSYTYNNTQSVIDCCFTGPPTSPADSFGPGTWRGKWWRVEGIIINRAGGPSPNGLAWKMYVKNITDNGPELKIIDSTIVDPTVGPQNAWLGWDDLTPPGGQRQDVFHINMYRQDTCNGYRAVSHMLLAGWDTNAGQRIGSAAEIEGRFP